ncbi:iron chelate uptake ABC transporter family permease subunit [Metabacillus litoralis]|uniref:Iron chelate uptake ABC transporter family permease subunit n=1 Tax=Metabacillus litoralis TaxID=152268 RepID=A0A5C6VX51_9BACI|nr:iron chelate uptake ABC transporter family permease subunit [Metabacillus litoralis]TXC89831.1 iron chelate uptake ABC transporter family permease subunit [Metabacillus litoralis]
MRRKSLILLGMVMIAVACFIFYDIGPNVDYVLPRRITKVAAIIVTGAAIAFATVIFQTITNNRILTPSIIGLDALYILLQTVIIFVAGSMSFFILNDYVNFLLGVVLMVIFSTLLFGFLFKREQNIYFLLLIGIIVGTLFGSLSTFMQILIDPNEFLMVQARMFASFNNIQTDLLLISLLLIGVALIFYWPNHKYLDVLSLGREHAINLGVDYDLVVKKLLIVVSILIAVSTALVGPITFLGLLVVNVTHEFYKTYKHKHLIVGSILISVIALVGGQFIVEKIFTFSTTVSVIVNFVGGVYFIYLLLKENRSW